MSFLYQMLCDAARAKVRSAVCKRTTRCDLETSTTHDGIYDLLWLRSALVAHLFGEGYGQLPITFEGRSALSGAK